LMLIVILLCDVRLWRKYLCCEFSSSARVHGITTLFPRFQASQKRTDSSDASSP
jgi:hypothetical protein